MKTKYMEFNNKRLLILGGNPETGALVRLASKSQLMAYQHEGFWQPMDTLRERNELEKLSLTDSPPWLAGIQN